MIKPEPRLRCRCGPRGIGPPKNRRQKSLKGSSSPNGLPNSGDAPPRPSLTWVVEMLTTTGRIFFAKLTKSGRPALVRTSLLPASPNMLTARLGANQSRLPLIPSPIASETKAINTAPFRPTPPAQISFSFIEWLLSFFDRLDVFHAQVVQDVFHQPIFARIEISPRFIFQQPQYIDHLLRRGHIDFNLAAQRVGNLTEMHERLRAQTDHKGRKVDLRQRLSGRALAKRFASLFAGFRLSLGLLLWSLLAHFTGLR